MLDECGYEIDRCSKDIISTREGREWGKLQIVMY